MIDQQEGPEASGARREGDRSGEPFRVALRLALLLYLAPLILTVLAIGGLGVLAGAIARASTGEGRRPPSGAVVGPKALGRGRPEAGPAIVPDRRGAGAGP